MNNPAINPWRNISYPFLWVSSSKWFLRCWEKILCTKGFHLFDECSDSQEHSLYCDACSLNVGIAYSYVEKEVEFGFCANCEDTVAPIQPGADGLKQCRQCGKVMCEKEKDERKLP